ncbi:MAG TPA: apolipoprotein N-acyltransferase [Salinivirga sp.]|uniref:apolipoprotein N-acyltransferase n=1 Tax=Salinivirga sp. TaxID=1970192 RepID=UPI002B46BA6C|nr:apolipoprotein N-acyltransferase [Salinivirga sp.]HKK60702.1 apolipoprotein N-acyltransferase [Salinivirga sp.]
MKPLFRLGLALLSGLMLTMAWYSEWMTVLLFIAFVPLLLIEEYYLDTRKNVFGVFNYSYLVFLIWNLFTTYWIYKATLPGAVMAVLANSALMAFIFWLYHLSRRWSDKKVGRYALVFWWITFEYLYFKTEISWPWLTLGNGFAFNAEWVQWYEYTGVLGGSLWILISNIIIVSSIAELVLQRNTMNKRLIANGVLFALIIFVPIILSYVRYHNYEEQGEQVEMVILQPNIDPYHEKFGSMGALEQTSRLLEVADNQITPRTKYVIGPETALVERIWEGHARDYGSVRMIEKFLEENTHLAFVVGASTRREYGEGDFIPPTARQFRNSETYYDRFNAALQITTYDIDFYHKSKLVPGVEKVPYYQYFKFLDNFAADLGGTVGSLGKQAESSVFRFMGTTVAPIICYESIYPEYVASYVKKGANFLFIITNDGWWGNTPGFEQHMRYARLRAIETRRSIARSANTGISAFINQRGDVIKPTKWWTPTSIKHAVAENDEVTYYVANGDYLGRVAAFFTILIILLMLVKKILNKKST